MTGAVMASGGLGGGGLTTPLPGGVATGISVSPVDARAAWYFWPTGEVFRGQAMSAVHVHDWTLKVRPGASTGLWIRATQTGGAYSPTTGPLGVWSAFPTEIYWELVNTVNQSTGTAYTHCELLIQIATDSLGMNIVTSGTYMLNANVSGSGGGGP